MSIATNLVTAEQYLKWPDTDCLTELIRGQVIEMNPPFARHGQICSKVDRIVGSYVDENELGHLIVNDSGVITKRDPDTVRGADVAFYSFELAPKGPLPTGYLPHPPELVFEVLSVQDRWSAVIAKVGEYLEVGVQVVCVLDPNESSIHVYRPDRSVEVLKEDDTFSLPNILGDFGTRVGRFFE
jgi:Uma2 family endonuclease